MKILLKIITVAILSVSITGCTGMSPEKLAQIESDCKQKDQNSTDFNYFSSNGECVAAYRSQSGYKSDKVLVFLHGSYSKGGDPLMEDYIEKRMDYLHEETGITVYVITYPGYKPSSSNKYMRWYNGNQSLWSKDYFILISQVLEQIKTKEKAKELYVFGHSLGGRFGGAILGLKPDLITKFVAYGSRFSTNNPGIQPIELGDRINKKTSVLLIVGEKDFRRNFSEEYNQMLQGHDIKSQLKIIPGEGHSIGSNNYKKIYKYVVDFLLFDQ